MTFPFPFIGRGGKTVACSGVRLDAVTGTTTPLSKTGAYIGNAAPDRWLVFVVSWDGNAALSSITVNGNAATMAANNRYVTPTPDIGAAICYIAWPSGTTADIVATWSADPTGGAVWTVFAVYGASSNSSNNTQQGNTFGISASVTFPLGAALFCAAACSATGAGFTSTGIIEILDQDLGSYRMLESYNNVGVGGSHTVTLDTGAGTYKTMAVAVFSP